MTTKLVDLADSGLFRVYVRDGHVILAAGEKRGQYLVETRVEYQLTPTMAQKIAEALKVASDAAWITEHESLS